MRKIPNLMVMVFLFCVTTASAQYDVPYVPTDYAVVDTMLSLAKVTSSDVLYDLGCGDGRIVIGAAKRNVGRAIGIDINPVRIQESNANAQKEGVAGKVEFREQNLFEADYRDATVITMYLLSSVNIRLRPVFFQVLKPGTRLVSHDFSMGDWEPDRTVEVLSESGWGNHTVYYWVIPANISGDWTFTAGDLPHTLHVVQRYQIATGVMTVNANKTDIPEGIQISGGDIQFSIPVTRETGNVVYQYKGTVSGDTITGTITQGQNVQKWSARRDPNTRAVIISESPQSAY